MKDKDYKGIDKLYHFAACLFISIYTTEGAILSAITKEYADWKNYGHFCLWDILADTLGTIAGTIIRVVIIKRWNWI